MTDKGKTIEGVPQSFSTSRYRGISTFRYPKVSNFKSLSFIWLDELLNCCDDDLNEIIQPFTWNFFNSISQCLSFIENQVREQNQIFLITSGSLGRHLFASGYEFMRTVSFVYIYCAEIDHHNRWIRECSDIRGAFNDSSTLGQMIKEDLEHAHRLQKEKNSTWSLQSNSYLQVRHNHIYNRIFSI